MEKALPGPVGVSGGGGEECWRTFCCKLGCGFFAGRGVARGDVDSRAAGDEAGADH